MTEIIWIGRGGQGAFTAAKLLGAAYSSKGNGYYSLAFPSFGPERRGAPVRAFTKLSASPVLDRSQTKKADNIIVLDKTLYSDDLKGLLKDGGSIIINSAEPVPGANTFDANSIAAELRLPVVNTIMLGALSGKTDIISEEDICRAIEGYMPKKLHEKNKNAVSKAIGVTK